MASGYFPPQQSSTYSSQPTPQLEYDVLHSQNLGQDQVLVTTIATFATLEDAQDAAQYTLSTVLDQYLMNGWSGYYCNDIDLALRGLITGLVNEHAYECLSEVCIIAKETALVPFQDHVTSTQEQWASSNQRAFSNVMVGEIRDYFRSKAAFRLSPFQPRAQDNFPQTRPLYPNRPDQFIPRPSAQYDQTMTFSTDYAHARSPTVVESSRTKRSQDLLKQRRCSKRSGTSKKTHRAKSSIGNILGGGDDISEPYQRRRHSSFDLTMLDKQFE